MKKAILKDKIIAYLIERKNDTGDNYPRISQIAAHIGVSETDTETMCKEMFADGHVTYTHDSNSGDSICAYRGEGDTFLNMEGGYTKLAKIKKHGEPIRRNDIFRSILKILFGLILGFVFRIITEPKCSQSETQQQSYQSQQKNSDSLNRK